jgi:hypothetical protein
MTDPGCHKSPLAGLDPAIHVFSCYVLFFWPEDVDTRDRPGQGD